MNEAQELSWRAWLALEFEAVWLYPVIGARHASLHEAAAAATRAHRERRDGLIAVFSAAGVSAPGPQLAYDVGVLDTPETAGAAARDVEERLCAAIVRLAGQVDGDHRATAISALRESALRALDWGGAAQPFPGLD